VSGEINPGEQLPEQEIDYGNGEGAAYGGSDPDVPVFTPERHHSGSHKYQSNTDNEANTEDVSKNMPRLLDAISKFFGVLSSGWNAATAIATVVIAVATVIYTIGALLQLRVMKKQLTEMHDSSVESGNQFQVQLRYFGASLGRQEVIAKHAEDQAKATQDAANAATDSAKTAKSSLASAQREFALSERAWISVDTAMQIYQPPVALVGSDGSQKSGDARAMYEDPNQIFLGNFHTQIAIHFENIGHSPALSIYPVRKQGFRDAKEGDASPRVDECNSTKPWKKIEFAAMPGKPYREESTGQLFSVEDVRAWTKGQKYFFAYGCIKYTDTLGGLHRSNFCSYYSSFNTKHEWQSCGTGNDAN